jgi:hypothetical protein
MMDGKPCRFPVQPTARKQFERGKCWSAMCNNPIWFVHLTVHGTADFGKCYCCAELRAYEYFVKKLPWRGRLVMPENGKPVEWKFDEEKLSFSPAKCKK